MNSFKANVINETQKLFLKKKITVFLIITAVVCFISAFFISSIQAKLAFIALSSVSFPMMTLSIFTNIFLPLFIFMAVSEVFSGELENKSLKLVLIRPISRFKIYISKNAAIAIYIIINLLVVLVASIVSTMLLKIGFAYQGVTQIIFGYFIDAIPAMVFVLFAAFIAQFFKSSSGALITCILCYLGIEVLCLFIKGFNNAIFTSYLNWCSMWSVGGAGFIRNINTFFMILAYGIIFFTVGYYVFDGKEV
jgi:hypothetical protein